MTEVCQTSMAEADFLPKMKQLWDGFSEHIKKEKHMYLRILMKIEKITNKLKEFFGTNL